MHFYICVGANAKRTMGEAQAQRESVKTSLKEIRNNIEALWLKLNRHTVKLQNAKAKYNELHEEQLRIQSSMQQLKQLEDRKKELYTREVTWGETVEKLRRDLSEAEDQLNDAARQLERTKVRSLQCP